MTAEKRTLADLAAKGYEAYAETTVGKNFRGEPMPTFENLPEVQRSAWANAAAAVAAESERKAERLKAALVYMLGTENIQELKGMEDVLRSVAAPDEEKSAALIAVRTMIEVLETCG